MAEPPLGAAWVEAEVMRIATASTSLDARAGALLGPLRRLVPFQAIRIALFDPECGVPVTLATEGYDDPVRAYFESPAVVDEFEQLGLRHRNSPICIRDLPVPELVRGWSEYLFPSGFREGLAVALVTPDGRRLGILGLNTDSPEHPTDEARDFIGLLAPMVAHAVDPMRSFAAATRVVRGAEAAILLTRSGNALTLPGQPGHHALRAGSAILTLVAEQMKNEVQYTSFLCPYPGRPAVSGHMRVTVLACQPQPPYDVRAIVAVSEPAPLRGLTRRELEILGLVVEGHPNAYIAAALAIAERTVATHVEHILAKFSADNRTVAATRALRQGLYVPEALSRSARRGHEW
jgi:DNA-binding CsgD family transcriptional regulator